MWCRCGRKKKKRGKKKKGKEKQNQKKISKSYLELFSTLCNSKVVNEYTRSKWRVGRALKYQQGYWELLSDPGGGESREGVFKKGNIHPQSDLVLLKCSLAI